MASVNAPKWWLRRRLRQAARLHKKGVINRWQYSNVAVKIGYALWRKPLPHGTLLEQYPFSVALGNALGLPKQHSESEYRDLLDAYGPFNEAITTFLTPGQLHLEAASGKVEALVWNSDHENAFKATVLRLSLPNRLAFRFTDWWKEQEQLFPPLTKMLTFVLGLVIGGVIGAVVGRLTR